MTIREVMNVVDPYTEVYFCDESGNVLAKASEVPERTGVWDAEVIGIGTYNYGIEIDADITPKMFQTMDEFLTERLLG